MHRPKPSGNWQLPNSAPTRRVIRALERAGAKFERQRGSSHAVYRRPLKGGKAATIIIKTDEEVIPQGTLRSIIRQAQLTPRQFLRFYSMTTMLLSLLHGFLPGAGTATYL